MATDRTELRTLTYDDTDAVFRHFSDEAVTRFMDIDVCQSAAEAHEIIRFHVEDTGCRWGIFDRDTGDLIGTCGYHAWKKPDRSAGVGYDLGAAYWGLGLMTEVLNVVLPFGFSEMSLVQVWADVEPNNVRSVDLLKRLGFQSGKVTDEGLLLFELDRDEP